LKNCYYLGFDVGGLFIKGGVIDSRGKLTTDVLSYYPSKSRASKEELLDHFVNMIIRQISSIMDRNFLIDGIVFAFPGPFDYENGISWIRGIEKFDSLYGVNIREELQERLGSERVFNNFASKDWKIFFENNVSLFGLGEWKLREKPDLSKMMCVTIGNGTGSAFLEKGEIIKKRNDVPPNGWIYNAPFRGSIVDDYISVRGILRIARDLGFGPDISLNMLIKEAKRGNPKACGVFEEFGRLLGEVLKKYVEKFQPEILVIGGYVSHYYEMFEDQLLAILANENVTIKKSHDTSISVLTGISEYIKRVRG